MRAFSSQFYDNFIIKQMFRLKSDFKILKRKEITPKCMHDKRCTTFGS